MKATVPLISASDGGGKDDTAVEMFGGTYRAPAVPEKREVVNVMLPSDPSDRELALKKWADDLGKWQASLESNSHTAGATATAPREPNWPPLLRFWRFFLPEIPQHAQAGVQVRAFASLGWSALSLTHTFSVCIGFFSWSCL